jgi:ribonuclease R
MSSKKKTSKIRSADPFYEREAAQYEFPMPSREYILQTLEAAGRPASFELLCELLDIGPHEWDIFRRRLNAMEREAGLMRNRKGDYIVPEKASLIAGRVQGHKDGYGFLIPDGGGPDLFLSPKEMDKVMHGDRVLGRVVGTDFKGRPEGVIVEVTERGQQQVVGRVVIEHGVIFVVPEDRRIGQDILIPPPEKEGKGGKKSGGKQPEWKKLKAGQVVVAEIIEPPTKYSQPVGRVIDVLGDYADPGMEIEIALRKHDLPFEFPKPALKEAKAMPEAVEPHEAAGRVDLRDLSLVTIDGETAKDFDDAVYCEKNGRGWRLVVAIADVSHYVRPGMALDHEAYERGNSVYFPRRVIPMLPEKISNGLCSLNPEVDRLAMVCDMSISATGAIKDYKFYEAVFRSKARLTYTQVWDWLSGEVGAAAKTGAVAGLWNRLTGKGAGADEKRKAALLPHLKNLYALFQILLKARAKRGAIDFETIETQMLFDEQGKIEKIIPVVRNDAHRLIEECMLAANVCASEFLAEHKQPCLYRIHEGPTPEKLDALRQFLKEFGLELPGGEEPHAKDYAKLIEKIKVRPDAALLQTVALRSLRQAMYSPDNVGHFGLAYEAYTHFTSPIRRYPDLLVHRAIKAALRKEKYAPGDWSNIGLHCSATERRADEATRDVDNWLKCYFMREHIGEIYHGTISSVVPFGVFVALDEVFIEGLVHVSELGPDYFEHDVVRHEMRGQRTGARYRLGQRLQVKVVRADLDTGKVDFVLVDSAGRTTAGAGKPAAGAGRESPGKKAARGRRR